MTRWRNRPTFDPRPVADALNAVRPGPSNAFTSWNWDLVRVQELHRIPEVGMERVVREFEIDWTRLDWDERLMLDALLQKAGGDMWPDYLSGEAT